MKDARDENGVASRELHIFSPSLLRVAPPTRALTLGMELHFPGKYERRQRESGPARSCCGELSFEVTLT